MQRAAPSIAAWPRPRLPRASRAALWLAAVLLPAAAFASWTLDTAHLAARLNGPLTQAYGLRIAAEGRASVALLPVPRVKIARASIVDAAGRPLVRDAQLRGELRLLPLLVGRVDIGQLEIAGGRIVLDGEHPAWTDALARLRGRAGREGDDAADIRRLVVSGAELELGGGDGVLLRKLDLTATWPAPDGDLDLSGSATWRGEPLTASAYLRRPGALAEGRAAAFDLQARGRPGSIALRGEISNRDGWRFDGETSGQAPSLGALARWLGDAGAPAALDVPVAFGGGATLTQTEIGWPRLRLDLAGDALEGALSIRLDPEGASGRATLAAGRLDLGWLARAAGPALAAWAEGSAPSRLLIDNRLDLRLSASALKVGALSLGDTALSILIDEGRLDAALLRAGLEGGSVKGRLAASFGGSRPDVKGQLAFEGVEAASVASAMGWGPWLATTMRGQASFDLSGGGDLLHQVAGRASVTLDGGDVSGPSLEALRRVADTPALPATLRAGRTSFTRAQLNVKLANGVAEIEPGSQVLADAFRAALQGRVSLPERFVSVRADATLAGHAGSRMMVDVDGPWNAPLFLRRAEPVPPQDGR